MDSVAQPNPHDDQVAVRIDDDLVIETPRGYEDEVRALFAADPGLRDSLVDFEDRLARGEVRTIPDAEVRRRLGLDPGPADGHPRTPAVEADVGASGIGRPGGGC
jgi:hypothetical protein